MPRVLCALCDTEITEQNDSEEHIIPNSIGGRKKLKGFICEDCNNKSGREWDAALARQFNPLSLLLGIKRERGEVPSQVFDTSSGQKVKLRLDGRMTYAQPEYSEKKVRDRIEVQIEARSMNEAKKILKGVKRKYPQIDIDEIIPHAKKQSSYLSEPLRIPLSLGGLIAGRSIVKSAMALAVKCGAGPRDCEKAREYLLADGEPCFDYYYEKDLVTDRPHEIPFHCVSVKGDHNTKQLVGYVELFGCLRMLICLSEKYEGREFAGCYAVDPIEGTELDITVNLDITPEDVRAAHNSESPDYNSARAAFEKIVSKGQQVAFEKEKNRVIDNAIEYAFSNCGAKEGESLTPKHVDELARLIIENLEPFLVHSLGREPTEFLQALRKVTDG